MPIGLLAQQKAVGPTYPELAEMEVLLVDTIGDMPNRYKHGGIEAIEAIRAALTDEEFRGFCKGNIIKYAWRERYKGGDEDIRKLSEYAKFAIEDSGAIE